jgi:hypothetical protein
MSSILYYSNFCEPSKKLLQTVSKTDIAKDIHFICIDKRVKENGKMFIILQNGQKIVMPENVTKVPALLLLNQQYKVIYGDQIYQQLKPAQEVQVQRATKNNMEPSAFLDGFGFGSGLGFGSGVISDYFSFLDQNDTELGTKGEGGLRQMHSYVSLENSNILSMHLPQDDHDYKADKLKDGELNIESLQRKREQELTSYK